MEKRRPAAPVADNKNRRVSDLGLTDFTAQDDVLNTSQQRVHTGGIQVDQGHKQATGRNSETIVPKQAQKS